jgi:hypothetical protein
VRVLGLVSGANDVAIGYWEKVVVVVVVVVVVMVVVVVVVVDVVVVVRVHIVTSSQITMSG